MNWGFHFATVDPSELSGTPSKTRPQRAIDESSVFFEKKWRIFVVPKLIHMWLVWHICGPCLLKTTFLEPACQITLYKGSLESLISKNNSITRLNMSVFRTNLGEKKTLPEFFTVSVFTVSNFLNIQGKSGGFLRRNPLEAPGVSSRTIAYENPSASQLQT